jgi:hypothetical protein
MVSRCRLLLFVKLAMNSLKHQAANPEVVDRLRQRLDQWRVESNAPMPERKDADRSQSPNSQSSRNDQARFPKG